MSNEQNTPNFHCNNKGRHITDPGYKPVCRFQCDECAQIYPAQQDMAQPKDAHLPQDVRERIEILESASKELKHERGGRPNAERIYFSEKTALLAMEKYAAKQVAAAMAGKIESDAKSDKDTF